MLFTQRLVSSPPVCLLVEALCLFQLRKVLTTHSCIEPGLKQDLLKPNHTTDCSAKHSLRERGDNTKGLVFTLQKWYRLSPSEPL